MDNTKPELNPFATQFLKDSSHFEVTTFKDFVRNEKKYAKDINKNCDIIIRDKNYVKADLKSSYMILKWDHTIFNEVIELLITAVDKYDKLRGAGVT